MKLIYTTETLCKKEDLLICIPTLEINAFAIPITQNTNWESLYLKYDLPILHQKNFLEIDGVKVDIKKCALELLGDSSFQSITTFLSNLASKRDIKCFKLCEYVFYNGFELKIAVAKTSMVLTNIISENPNMEKPIESVMKIRVGDIYLPWYDCSTDNQISWYSEQKKVLKKLLGV